MPNLTIHKTLKENLPLQINNKDEIHFTEDGRIYINRNDGKLQACNTGDIIREVNNPLTTEPLEYGYFVMSDRQTTDFNVGMPIKFDKILEGNIELLNNSIKLKANKTYKIDLGLVIQATRCDVQIKNITTNEFIGKKIICVPPTSSFLFSPLASTSFIYRPDKDCDISVIITQSESVAIVFDQYASLSVNEIRNNPVNQYGGFETKVLFEGEVNNIGDYQLTDNVNNYNFLAIISAIYDDGIPLVPVMTSNTTPAPYVISSSGFLTSGYEEYKAFDGTNISNTDCFHSSKNELVSKDNPIWLQISFPKPEVVDRIIFESRNDVLSNSQAPRHLIIKGSNDETSWVDLYEKENITWSSPKQSLIMDFENKNEYKFYRLCSVSASVNGYYMACGQLKLMKVNNKKLQSHFEIIQTDIDINNENWKIYFNSNYMKVSKINSHISKIVGIKGQLPSLLSGGEF